MRTDSKEVVTLGLYATVAKYAFRRGFVYWIATVSGAFTNTVFGVLRAYVLIALWHARPALGGYDVTDAVTFSFLSQAMLAPTQIFYGGLELVDRIRNGDVAVDLHRPADLQGWWFADDMGRAAFAVLFRAIPPVAAGFLLFPVRLPGPATWAAFAGSLVLGLVVSFALRYLVSLAVFWLHDDRGIRAAAIITSMFFSGMILPLVVFPGALGTVANLLPWAALIQVPADIFLGKTGSVAGAYAFQAGWALLLIAAGRLATARARRRLVINGG